MLEYCESLVISGEIEGGYEIMKKKILTGLAAAMVAAMMVGCGSGETAETTTAAAETTTIM